MSAKIMDRLFLRALITAFGFRPHDRRPEAFIPYFQYKIGPYVSDFYLYFPKPPAWNRYRYELFDKLAVYHGSDIARYLDFHFSAYPDKGAFLRFLRFEVEGQLKYIGSKKSAWRRKMELMLSWIVEQESLLKPVNGAPATMDAQMGGQSVEGAEPAGSGIEAGVPDIELGVQEVLRSFSGNIVVNGKHHLERLIQLLILLKDLHAPNKPDQPVFAQFSTGDLAAILRQIKEMKEFKVNTLQKKIADCNRTLRHSDPPTAQLTAALTAFFYGLPAR